MAKPLTRLIRTLANKCGYDLLRLQKVHISEAARTGQGRGGGFDAFDAAAPRVVKSFDIYFRSCSRVQIFGSDASRIENTPKQDVLLTCLNSLIRSIQYAVNQKIDCEFTLTIMDDYSDQGCIEKAKQLLANAPCKTTFIALDVTGNGNSLGAVYTHAKNTGRDLIYQVEDDYLHMEKAVYEMIMSYGRLAATYQQDVVLFPSDAPNLYRTISPTQVLLGNDRHWRQIYSTTCTFVTTKKLMDKYWERYHALSGYGIDPEVTEITTINRIYEEVPCFSPLPALSIHFSEYEWIPPFTDWRNLWKEMAPDNLA